MQFLPIDIDESKNLQFSYHPECLQVLNVYPGYYNRVGYNKPWIGYFATIDGKEIIGCGGFKGKPKEGKVEVAYGTFKNHERKGFGTEICRQLVLLSLQSDPTIRITARTLMENNASTQILKKNGFKFNGIVFDEEDGDVWEWELKNQTLNL
ncbi:MAG: GNAT family N-acetyltransferase [Flavisolibacter sp.]